MSKTLYLRNVPDEVVARLTLLAEREGMSTSAFAVRELAHLARRADNAAFFAGLPDIDLEMGDVVSGIRADRDGHSGDLG